MTTDQKITRRDWWIGVGLVGFGLLLHAAVPRYQWQHEGSVVWLRVDRWTGNAELVIVRPGLGTRFPVR